MSIPIVLVTRGTGTQGRSVVRKCLAHGFKVHTIVRDAKEDRAVSLQKLGTTLFEGSIDDPETLSRAVQGCTYLYIALMPRFDEEASELRQTRAIIAAAQSSTPPVRHVVVSTALNRTDSGDEMLENELYQRFKQNKLSVEHAISQAGFVTWTVLRPGYFMTNFLFPLGDMMFPQMVAEGKFVNALGPQTRLPLIDPDDIGAFAVSIFQQPQRFDQKIINLASESRTTIDTVAALGKASGKPLEAVWLDDDEARKVAKTNPMIMGQILTRELDRLIDYGELKECGLVPGTFDAFLKREEALVQKTFHGVREKQFSLFEEANK